MQFARRFWIAAVCTLSLLFAATAAQAQQFKLLPNDTEMIVTFNLQQILKSEVMKANKKLLDPLKDKLKEFLDDKGLAKHLMKADFDLFRDLTSVTVAVPGGRNPEEGFIILEGKFDAEKIEAAVAEAGKDAGVKITKIANVKAFEVSPNAEKTMYVGILNTKTMIVCGTKADFTNAVARMNDGKVKFKATALAKLMSTVNNKQSISLVATGSVLAKLAANSPQADNDQAQQAMQIIKTMEGISTAITIQKNIDFQLGLNTADAETALKYAGVANLLIGVIKTKAAEKAKQDEKFAPAVDVVNSIRVSSMEANLLIRGQITFENLNKIIESLPIPNN